MRAAFTTGLELAGFAVIAAGFWLLSPVCGLIAAGSALVLIGFVNA